MRACVRACVRVCVCVCVCVCVSDEMSVSLCLCKHYRLLRDGAQKVISISLLSHRAVLLRLIMFCGHCLVAVTLTVNETL